MSPEASRRRQRVVLDSNVWISAALSRQGAPAQLVRRVLAAGLPVFSAATFAELEARLWPPKFDRYLSLEMRQRLLHDANAVAHWVDIPPALASQTWCRDPDDEHFVRAALAAEARWLVSGDRDLLDIEPPTGLRIVTPAAALDDPGFCT